LEEQLREIGGPWWRARNLPPDEQRAVVAQQTELLRGRLEKRLSAKQWTRLNQLETQAQGTRCLLRADIAQRLGLTPEQQSRLQKLADDTTTRQREYQVTVEKGTPDQTLKTAWLEQQQREVTESVGLLDARQQKLMQEILGSQVDLSQAQRVFPMAPEFAADSLWIGPSPGNMSDLRGRVVVVHFYAFQCINCQRNFPHYCRWGEQWNDKGVVLVGIQTPETSAERDLARVQQAATQDGFNFPVIMDTEQRNWQAWGNTMWPTVYVIDKHGYIRMWWQGELNWQGATGDSKISELVEQLLKE
jgi:peroxiredoxin